MKLYFLDTEPSEQRYFERALPEHELRFVRTLTEVPPEADGISIFIGSEIDSSFLNSHPSLRLIASRSTTHDHIDLDACAQHRVAVTYVPTYGDHTVAEHTMALMLALARRLREAMDSTSRSAFSYEALRGFQLRGKMLGVIGAGRIGLHVLRLATAFGMRCIVHDPFPRPQAARLVGFRYVALADLLKDSDIISLHAALTPESFHILDAAAFAQCKKGVIVINTARGALIDTKALLDAMKAGIVDGVGVDVLEDERVMRGGCSHILTSQIVEHLHETFRPAEARNHDANRVKDLARLLHNGALLAHRRVIFTPHIAFNSVEAIEQINRTTAENIKAFARGQPSMY